MALAFPLASAMGCAATAPAQPDRKLILEWREARPLEKTGAQVETLRIFSDGTGNEIELASFTETKRSHGHADSGSPGLQQRRCRLQAADRQKVAGAVGTVKFPAGPAALQPGRRSQICARTPTETAPLRCGDAKGSPRLIDLLSDLRQTCQDGP